MPSATLSRPHRLRPRAGLAGLLLAGLFGLAVGAGVGAQPESPRAGLVILDGQGELHTFCVDLGAPEISGLELLQASGVDLVQQQNLLGSMVCRIDQTGCDYPAEACWCHCKNLAGDCRYWAYHQLEDGDWNYGLLGPSSRRIRHGDVDGWAWGPGSVVAGARPPLRSFEQICTASDAGRPSPTSTPPHATARPTRLGATSAAGPTPTTPAGSGREPRATLRSTGVSSPSTRGAGSPGGGPTPEDDPASTSEDSDRASGTAGEAAGSDRSDRGESGLGTSEAGAASSGGSGDDPGAADGADSVAMAPAGRDAQGAEDAGKSRSGRTDEAAGARDAGGASSSDGRPNPSLGGSDDPAPAGPSAAAPSPPDARTMAGYLLFGLIFLGLAGIALSGRRR